MSVDTLGMFGGGYDFDSLNSFNSFNVPGGFSNGGSSGGGGGIDWNSIIQQGIAVGSQAIGAWGHNQTQQVGNSQYVTGIGQGYSPAAAAAAAAAQQQAANQQAAMMIGSRGGTTQGGVAEDALGSVSSFVSQHPLMVFGGIAALFLLYRQPPSRR